MKLGPISLEWQRKKASSNEWELDSTPTGEEEQALFKMPNLMESPSSGAVLRALQLCPHPQEPESYPGYGCLCVEPPLGCCRYRGSG